MKLDTCNLELVKGKDTITKGNEWIVEGKVSIVMEAGDFQMDQKDFRSAIDAILNECVPAGVLNPNWSFGLPSVNRWEYWIRSFKKA